MPRRRFRSGGNFSGNSRPERGVPEAPTGRTRKMTIAQEAAVSNPTMYTKQCKRTAV